MDLQAATALAALIRASWPDGEGPFTPDLQAISSIPDLHRTAQEILDGPRWQWGQPVHKAYVYTDGTASTPGACHFPAAWAAVIYLEDAGGDGGLGTILSGALGTTSTLSPAGTRTPGDGSPDSLRAEGAALLWAMLWVAQAAQHATFKDASFIIRYDAEVTGQAARGGWQLEADPAMHAQLFDMYSLVTETATLSALHVKGHAGHALNELADGAAKSARIGNAAPPGEPGRRFDRWLEDPQAAAWAWLAIAATDPARGYPR